jgi:hypothetical protein
MSRRQRFRLRRKPCRSGGTGFIYSAAINNGIFSPQQIEGLRLLITPFPQQQFNATADRRSNLLAQVLVPTNRP